MDTMEYIEEHTNELIDECATLLSQIQDTRYKFYATAYSPEAPDKVANYAKNLVDILYDYAERIYDLKRNMEMSR